MIRGNDFILVLPRYSRLRINPIIYIRSTIVQYSFVKKIKSVVRGEIRYLYIVKQTVKIEKYIIIYVYET